MLWQFRFLHLDFLGGMCQKLLQSLMLWIRIKKANLTISKAELEVVAEKIFKNEAGGKKEELVYWNSGEDFPSLGIGHFIWYKQGQKGRFEESFPPLVEYYKARNVKLPRIMEKNKYSPWQSRDELFRLKKFWK